MTFRGGFAASVILAVVAFYGCADSGGAANGASAGNAGNPQTAGESTGASSNGGSGAPGGKSSGGAPGEAGAFGEVAGLGGVAETGGAAVGALGGASGAALGGAGNADGGVSGEGAGVAGAAGTPSVPNDCSRDVDCGQGYHCAGTAAQLCFTDPSWQCTRGDECTTGSVDRACGKDQHCQLRGNPGDACGDNLPRCDDNFTCNPDTATCDLPTDPVSGGFDKFYCLGGYCDLGDFCRTITSQSACDPIFMDMTGYTCDENADCGPYFSCSTQQCKISSKVCTKDTDCGAGEFCSAQLGKRCFPLGGARASCTANTQCLPTAYCDGSTKKCAWYPLEGEPCQQGHCGPELACGPGFVGGHCEQN